MIIILFKKKKKNYAFKISEIRKVGRAINRANEIHEMKKYGRIFVEIYRKN